MELTTQIQETAPQGLVSIEQKKAISFYLGEHLFGVDILTVKEVTPLVEITPVHHSPKEVRGYLNLRGEIHLVLDLRYLLGLGEQKASQKEMVIIFKSQVAPPFGIIVDEIGEVLEFTQEDIEYSSNQSDDANGMSQKMVMGVLKQEDSLMTLLDAFKFLSHS